MKTYISQAMQDFLTPGANEEALDQPLYHIQAYGTGGATSFTFFNTAVGSATNGLSDTNMDASAVLSAGKRFGVFAISVGFIGGASPIQMDATTATLNLEDAKKVIEGLGNLQFKILDKTYLTEAPLMRVPAGMGLNIGAGGVTATLAAGASKQSVCDYGSNGAPMILNKRYLKVPLPIPQQVRFEVTINFPSAITVGTAGRLGVWLDGMMIRAKQ